MKRENDRGAEDIWRELSEEEREVTTGPSMSRPSKP